jgi:hypothetical protein
MFCALGLILGGTEGVRSSFHVLRSRSRFRRNRGRWVPFSCFTLPNSFRSVPMALSPVFMFCSRGLVWGYIKGVGPHFHVLRSRIRLGTYQGQRVPFLSFALSDTFWAVPRASSPVFIFCAYEIVFDGTEDIRSYFHILRSHTRFVPYRGRWVPFSCFALPDSFSAVPRASGPVFIFFAFERVFDGTEGLGFCFHVLRSRTRFGLHRQRRFPFSCFALRDLFGSVQSASGPVFMFCAPGLAFDGTEGAGPRFHVLRSRNRLGSYQGQQVPFSSFELLDTFFTVPRAPCPVFIFCAPGLIFDGSEGAESRIHVLRSRTHFGQYRGC